jgi:hypothetical protein
MSSYEMSCRKEKLKEIGGITFWLIDSIRLSQYDPKWSPTRATRYIGSHHYGMGTSYIPEPEVWISDAVIDVQKQKIIMIHEFIEREVMKRILEKINITGPLVWDIGHKVALTLQDYLVFSFQLGDEVLVGGLADGMPDSAFEKDQLEVGEKIETEHIGNNPDKVFARAVAREIAKDHCKEFANYYDYLQLLETLMEIDKDENGTRWLQKLKDLTEQALK